MKRFFVLLLTILAIITMAFGLTGCFHEHVYSSQTTVAPTCTEKGYVLYTCECGSSIKRNYVECLGHDLGDFTQIAPSTCSEKGSEKAYCLRDGCNHIEIREKDFADHEYGVDGFCINCGHTSRQVLIIDKVSAKAGDEVVIKIELNNNPGIVGMTLQLLFDDQVLTLTNAVKGDALETLEMTAPGQFVGGCKFGWDGVSEDQTSGTLITFTFKVSALATNGEYGITLLYNEGDIFDNEYNPVSLDIISGSITVG